MRLVPRTPEFTGRHSDHTEESARQVRLIGESGAMRHAGHGLALLDEGARRIHLPLQGVRVRRDTESAGKGMRKRESAESCKSCHLGERHATERVVVDETTHARDARCDAEITGRLTELRVGLHAHIEHEFTKGVERRFIASLLHLQEVRLHVENPLDECAVTNNEWAVRQQAATIMVIGKRGDLRRRQVQRAILPCVGAQAVRIVQDARRDDQHIATSNGQCTTRAMHHRFAVQHDTDDRRLLRVRRKSMMLILGLELFDSAEQRGNGEVPEPLAGARGGIRRTPHDR